MAARARGWGARLATIVAAGVALRLVHALLIAPDTPLFGDGWFFHEVAKLVANGHGYSSPAAFIFHGVEKPTAEHPPLFTLAVAGVTKLGVTSDQAQRTLLGCSSGAGTLTALGFLGRRVGGERAGLLAAAIGAVYPILVAADGALMSETLYGLLIALALLAALRLVARPSLGSAALLGAAIGLATLTRAEALLLVLLLALPGAWLAGAGLRSRGAPGAAACLATALVLSPWVGRNWHVFGQPALSTNDGTVLTGANCDATYYGPQVGSFVTRCIPPVRHRNEARQDAEWRRDARRYVSDHVGRLPVVMAARLGRVWGFYRPGQQAYNAEGRRLAVQRAGTFLYYPLLVLALCGAIALRRRKAELALLIAPIVLVSLTAITGYGAVRLRHAAELPLVVLAAVGLERIARRRLPSAKRGPSSSRGPRRTPSRRSG